MNIIVTIKFFFRKFLKADQKHQSLMQSEKPLNFLDVQKTKGPGQTLT